MIQINAIQSSSTATLIKTSKGRKKQRITLIDLPTKKEQALYRFATIGHTLNKAPKHSVYLCIQKSHFIKVNRESLRKRLNLTKKQFLKERKQNLGNFTEFVLQKLKFNETKPSTVPVKHTRASSSPGTKLRIAILPAKPILDTFVQEEPEKVSLGQRTETEEEFLQKVDPKNKDFEVGEIVLVQRSTGHPQYVRISHITPRMINFVMEEGSQGAKSEKYVFKLLKKVDVIDSKNLSSIVGQMIPEEEFETMTIFKENKDFVDGELVIIKRGEKNKLYYQYGIYRGSHKKGLCIDIGQPKGVFKKPGQVFKLISGD